MGQSQDHTRVLPGGLHAWGQGLWSKIAFTGLNARQSNQWMDNQTILDKDACKRWAWTDQMWIKIDMTINQSRQVMINKWQGMIKSGSRETCTRASGNRFRHRLGTGNSLCNHQLSDYFIALAWPVLTGAGTSITYISNKNLVGWQQLSWCSGICR